MQIEVARVAIEVNIGLVFGPSSYRKRCTTRAVQKQKVRMRALMMALVKQKYAGQTARLAAETASLLMLQDVFYLMPHPPGADLS